MSDTTIFSYIRQNVDIIDVVQNYVALKKAGSYFKGFSPFRSEKTPSFTVSPEKKIFYCFSTNIGGDVIDFISRIERCSQIEAAYFLKERYNLVLPADISRQHGKQQDNDTSSREMYYKVCSFFNKWLIEELKTYLPAQEYLARRAFSKMAINHFQLGYCPTGEQVVSRCIEEAKKNNILITDLLKAGILQEHQERSSFRKSLYHIPFDDRIVFPIFDSLGKPIAFSGRVFQMGDERVKYYNTSSNGEFFKKKVLYNFDKARSFIHKAQEVLMVEGYCDVIGLWHMGHYNVVATMGTACTQEHIRLLSKHAQKIIALYDSDKAGQDAMVRIAKMCLQELVDLEVVTLPEGEDPASLWQKGIQLDISKKVTGITFLIQKILYEKTDKSLKIRAEGLQEIVECVSYIQNPIEKNLVIQELVRVSGIPAAVFSKAAHQKLQENTFNGHTDEHVSEHKALEDIPALLNRLLLLIIMYGGKNPFWYDQAVALIEKAGDDDLIMVLNFYKKEKEAGKIGTDYLVFFDILDENKKISILSCGHSDTEEIAVILCSLLKKKLWKKMVINYHHRIESGSDANDSHELLREFQKLKEKF